MQIGMEHAESEGVAHEIVDYVGDEFRRIKSDRFQFRELLLVALLHQPQVLHYGQQGTGLVLAAGMTFTIEPMINAGRADIRQLADGWTIVTKDHSLSAQWEHTVLVTDDGFEVLTLSGGAPAQPDFVIQRHA